MEVNYVDYLNIIRIETPALTQDTTLKPMILQQWSAIKAKNISQKIQAIYAYDAIRI